MALEDLLLNFSEATGISYLLITFRWGWPIAETLHFTGLCLLFGCIGFFDLRVLGWAKGLPLAELHKLIPIGIGGYILNVITGVMFVTTVPDQYIYNPAFQTKMFFMMTAGINMLLFYRLSYKDLIKLGPGEPAPVKAKVFVFISLLAWLGVIACGRLITFFRPPFFWCFWC